MGELAENGGILSYWGNSFTLRHNSEFHFKPTRPWTWGELTTLPTSDELETCFLSFSRKVTHRKQLVFTVRLLLKTLCCKQNVRFVRCEVASHTQNTSISHSRFMRCEMASYTQNTPTSNSKHNHSPAMGSGIVLHYDTFWVHIVLLPGKRIRTEAL